MDERPDGRDSELQEEILEASGSPTSGTIISPQTSDTNLPPASDQLVTGQPLVSEGSLDKSHSPFSRIRGSKNFYLFVFSLLLLLAGAAVFGAVRWGQDESGNKNNGPQTLTGDQLTELAGNTTLVGDPKQTLDIQSNTVFEGQVLARADLDVAGSLKVGGVLSLPSISAAEASFEQLSVSGNLTVQNITVAKATSFTTLSASQLSVSSLQLTGDLTISRHITPAGGVPGKSNGSALGSGGTASVSGSDTAGTISVNTGSGPPAGCFITVNFVAKFNTTPRVIVSASNSSAGGLSYYTNRSTTNFSLCTVSAPSASTNYIFDYIVFD